MDSDQYLRKRIMTVTTSPVPTREIDVTGMEPPEPMLAILEALEAMPEHGVLQVRLDREPHPLFRVLDQNDYRRSGSWQDDSSYQLLIWRGSPICACSCAGH
jgi:TusA-related sulfurtransferase